MAAKQKEEEEERAGARAQRERERERRGLGGEPTERALTGAGQAAGWSSAPEW